MKVQSRETNDYLLRAFIKGKQLSPIFFPFFLFLFEGWFADFLRSCTKSGASSLPFCDISLLSFLNIYFNIIFFRAIIYSALTVLFITAVIFLINRTQQIPSLC